MNILAIDSSGLVASVAIWSDHTIIAEYTVNYKKTHSQTLLPMLDAVIKMISMDLSVIDAIAIAGGPGSFTGLRIGSATAKGLGLALQKPLIHIPTLEGLAYNLFGTGRLICPLMDAKRSQVYTGLYEFQEESFHIVSEQKAVSIYEMIEEINQLGREVIFLGDGVEPNREILQQEVKVPYLFAPAHQSRQRAASVAELGAIYYMHGKTEEAAEHKPVYLRLSQAERELLQKEQRNL